MQLSTRTLQRSSKKSSRNGANSKKISSHQYLESQLPSNFSQSQLSSSQGCNSNQITSNFNVAHKRQQTQSDGMTAPLEI